MAFFPSPCHKIVMITNLLLVVSSISAYPIGRNDDFPQGAFGIVRRIMENVINNEPRMGASILRLQFHDCFVNGCDGSVLLDDTPNSRGEKGALPNRNSARGFEVIDDIKKSFRGRVPGRVSCADILAIAARDAVNILGGPLWEVKTGRRDSLSASLTAANNGIPPPNSSIDDLITKYSSLGLTTRDLVALSGAHTLGFAKCTTFRDRIYNETTSTINIAFAQQKRRNCPSASGTPKDNNTEPLDLQTPKFFDNKYFVNLVAKRGLLHSDQELFSGGSEDSTNIVQDYANYPFHFYKDFVSAMIKMGDIKTLTGSNGQIRKDCRKRN